ncbi:predicted protein [Nematostella vectensis]|uniref:Uncharacterized protein n=2 Tax=Nematostella vectensis TaxID=45351 RepID=A7SRW3_NEMVE|nr:predicted protein [Nematostella vectensis]|eukprot:XP_001625635.1 predicted protein [Nematostella vectensis]
MESNDEESKTFRYVFDPMRKTSIKVLRETPSKHRPTLHILNLQEEKDKFLRFGKTPKFQFSRPIDTYPKKKKTDIRFEFLPEAKLILERVRQHFGSGDNFLDAAFGKKLDRSEATEFMMNYIKSHGLDGQLNIIWANDVHGSGRLLWQGPNVRFNRPEARKFTLILKGNKENTFLRTHGIQSLADHEIGTHFMRSANDGLQPWFSNRQKFGLRSSRSLCGLVCEEGLAAINTLLQSQVKLLFMPALLYYTACMSEQMTFKELFDHLGTYIFDMDQRWKQVTRVKRILPDCNHHGGSGQDQCYFEGAIQILRQADEIDFKLLYAGKICVDELPRVRRIARQECIKLPLFLKDMAAYTHSLNEMAILNGLIQRVKRPLSCRLPSSRHRRRNVRGNSRCRGNVRALSSPMRARTLPLTPRPPLLSRRSNKPLLLRKEAFID